MLGHGSPTVNSQVCPRWWVRVTQARPSSASRLPEASDQPFQPQASPSRASANPERHAPQAAELAHHVAVARGSGRRAATTPPGPAGRGTLRPGRRTGRLTAASSGLSPHVQTREPDRKSRTGRGIGPIAGELKSRGAGNDAELSPSQTPREAVGRRAVPAP